MFHRTVVDPALFQGSHTLADLVQHVQANPTPTAELLARMDEILALDVDAIQDQLPVTAAEAKFIQGIIRTLAGRVRAQVEAA